MVAFGLVYAETVARAGFAVDRRHRAYELVDTALRHVLVGRGGHHHEGTRRDAVSDNFGMIEVPQYVGHVEVGAVPVQVAAPYDAFQLSHAAADRDARGEPRGAGHGVPRRVPAQGHAGQPHLVVPDPVLCLEHADAPERFLHEEPHLGNAVGEQVLELDVPGYFRRAPAVASLGRDGQRDVAAPGQFPRPAIERRFVRTVLVEPLEGHAFGRSARARNADHAREVLGRVVQWLDQDGRDRLIVRIGVGQIREPDVVFHPGIALGEIDLRGDVRHAEKLQQLLTDLPGWDRLGIPRTQPLAVIGGRERLFHAAPRHRFNERRWMRAGPATRQALTSAGPEAARLSITPRGLAGEADPATPTRRRAETRACGFAPLRCSVRRRA